MRGARGEAHACCRVFAAVTMGSTFERGDCLVFLSHKTHSVAQLTRGRRSVLVVEFWHECACVSNHRCMGQRPCGMWHGAL